MTAMVTPFNEQDQLDLNVLKTLIDYLLKNNTTSLLLSGTTGEAPTLSEDEKILLFKKSIEYVDKKVPIIANVGTNSTKKTIHFMKKLEDLDLDGYLVVVPYYNRPDQEGIYEHFKHIAKETKRPIIIYNIPKRTGVDLELDTIIKLSKIKNIKGIKESSGDVNKLKDIIDKTQDDFLVYTGDDHQILDAFKLGADGVVSVASHIFGKSIHTIVQLIYNKQYENAEAIFNIYIDKFNALFMRPNPAPTKAALTKLGLYVGGVRLPLVDLSEDEEMRLYEIIGI
ncbi:4-hydroxy-tetrahydrodipicolinate synthase protein [Haloplasma contractile SSD-17B]|uniref:4-hydroxy-tetrahydrodipicolinate synthase n=2 Tax=Haloplasma TaxID=471824 RepID=U2EFI2_9MOLU|nr:4-hydroxy-tetrahydrodipicolinate synthase protein [Haloplasma contractile SSD-17B]